MATLAPVHADELKQRVGCLQSHRLWGAGLLLQGLETYLLSGVGHDHLGEGTLLPHSCWRGAGTWVTESHSSQRVTQHNCMPEMLWSSS